MRTLALAALAAVQAACLLPPDNDVVQWSDDFERCDDLCDWTGTGMARVTTYHPGEHAMRLDARGAAHHAVQITRQADDDFGSQPPRNNSDGNWLELTTDCGGPGTLEMRADGVDRYAIEVALDDRGLGELTRHRLSFPPVDATRTATFDALELTAGALACTIDNVQLRISGGDYGY